MDLAVEFQKLKEGQERILQLFSNNNIVKEETSKIYTLDQLAQLFSVTKRTIYNWKDEGRLPLTVIGSKSYMTESQLQVFLANNEVKPLNVRRA